jgi:hypothetical protein
MNTVFPHLSELPSLENLKARGDKAKVQLAEVVEEGRQLRQTMLYCVASVRKSARHLCDGRQIMLDPFQTATSER